MTDSEVLGERTVAAFREGRTVLLTLRWSRAGVNASRSRYSVILNGPDIQIERVADDAFDALAQVREALEPTGWKLAVEGACRDVYPSGMARDTGGGVHAYRLVPGKKPRLSDLVETFAELPPDQYNRVGSVAEQRDHFLAVLKANDRE